ncbi:MAG: 5'-3' exonuclease H3TH domain-containing protein [Limisphaerales bacterium]
MSTVHNEGSLPASTPPGSSRLLIVDGHAYAYRAFHAIRQLNAPDGSPTNAIYGFIKMLGKMRATLAPTHTAVIWDGGLSAERTTAHPEYKAQRPSMPEGLARQMDGIVEYLRAAGIASWCHDGVEADDWIAAAARRAAAEGVHVVIASADKDFMQLVAPGIGLLNPNDKTERIWTAADVEAKSGVRPEQIVDWLSLVGDAVDNIPGVPGVGPKTATSLLRQFGSIASLYTRLEEVSSDRVRENLAAAALVVERNRDLIRLRDDAGAPFNLAETAPAAEDTGRLMELFERWGFRSMRQALETRAGPSQGEML